MWPFRIELGPLSIGSSELFILFAAGVVCALAWPRLKALGISPGSLFDLTLGTVIGGAVGARLFYSVPLWIRGVEGMSHAPAWSDGSALYGGLLGGLAGLAAMARFKKLPALEVLDAAAFGMPLGFATGKVGCFLAGCCYGGRCDSSSCLAFAPGSLAYRTQVARGELSEGAAAALPVFPIQIYDVAFGIALFALLFWLRKGSRRPGEVLLAFLAGYSWYRFFIEFYRDDPGRHGFNAGISDSQVAAIVVLVVSAVCWIALRRRPAPSTAS